MGVKVLWRGLGPDGCYRNVTVKSIVASGFGPGSLFCWELCRMAIADWGPIAFIVAMGILAILMAFEHSDALRPRQGAGERQRRWLKIKRSRKS